MRDAGLREEARSSRGLYSVPFSTYIHTYLTHRGYYYQGSSSSSTGTIPIPSPLTYKDLPSNLRLLDCRGDNPSAVIDCTAEPPAAPPPPVFALAAAPASRLGSARRAAKTELRQLCIIGLGRPSLRLWLSLLHPSTTSSRRTAARHRSAPFRPSGLPTPRSQLTRRAVVVLCRHPSEPRRRRRARQRPLCPAPPSLPWTARRPRDMPPP